jgi:hypothetical protein
LPPARVARTPEPSALAVPVVLETATFSAEAAEAGPAAASLPVADAPVERAPLAVVVEKPYLPYQRPRPAGSVNASVADVQLARWNVGGTGDPDYVSNRADFHPATRVRVDARVISGHLPSRRSGRRHARLTRADVLAESRSHGYWPFRLCFEDDEHDHAHLHGQSTFVLSVSRTGRVARARLERTHLDDHDVARCLLDRARHLHFAPAPGHAIRVWLSVKLWPGDAPLPRHDLASELDPAQPQALALGAVERAAAPLETEVAGCYRAGLERDRKLWGRIELRIDLDRHGRVRAARQVESRFPDYQVVRCVEDALSSVTFPAPARGPASFIYAVRLGRPPGRAEMDGSRVLAPEPSAVDRGRGPS